MIDKTSLIWIVFIAVCLAAGLWLGKHQTPGLVPDDDVIDYDDEEDDSPARGQVDVGSTYYLSEHEHDFTITDDDYFMKD